MSFLKMCVPADGVKGIKQFVLESIVGAGGKPCPPGIVGVGIGGSADYAMYLAKEAIARPIGTRNPDPHVARLEEELFELLNETGIGPMGLGGDVTVLNCHIEHADTHMTLNPVAVNYQCWAARRATARVAADGTTTFDREVLVQGRVIGIRDRTQIRIFDQGVEPPMDLRGAFLLHTAPNVRKVGEGRYEKICIGTTTSARMVRFTEPLGAQYGVRAICGKGGFPDEAIEPMRRHGMVYFAIVGGAAALETTQIEEIEEVAWEELMPECLWKFRVKDFGPLTVGIDAHGNSLYHDVQAAARRKLEELYARL
jgi:tartrate/fumarate subfamily iron-sulfur-dependent hydro-lyase beta chain